MTSNRCFARILNQDVWLLDVVILCRNVPCGLKSLLHLNRSKGQEKKVLCIKKVNQKKMHDRQLCSLCPRERDSHLESWSRQGFTLLPPSLPPSLPLFIHTFGRPGIEPTAPAVEARSFNRWTAREVPTLHLIRGICSGAFYTPERKHYGRWLW